MLRTKAAISMEEMGDQYCMIGPYFEKNVKMEVEVMMPSEIEPMYKVIEKMKSYGYKVCCRFLVLLLSLIFHVIFWFRSVYYTGYESGPIYQQSLGCDSLFIRSDKGQQTISLPRYLV